MNKEDANINTITRLFCESFHNSTKKIYNDLCAYCYTYNKNCISINKKSYCEECMGIIKHKNKETNNGKNI